MKAVLAVLFGILAAQAQLAVRVSAPKVAGQKAVIPLAIENDSLTMIESVRATLFISDEAGKILAQRTQWIVGGRKEEPGLDARSTNVFHFVVTGEKPFAGTNITSRVVVNRVVLDGGKLSSPSDVRVYSDFITNQTK